MGIETSNTNTVQIKDVSWYLLDGVKLTVEEDSSWEVIQTNGSLVLHEKNSRKNDAFRIIQVAGLIDPYFYYTQEDWDRENERYKAIDKKEKDRTEKEEQNKKLLGKILLAISIISVISIIALATLLK